ncbi:long-chain acyl-CoA synthetase [Spinactinospora alkalitolerans]|uniref:Acyl-CoA synthetase n=1 Tax=Spinactinospora alkalitolerans TaxID=687207 RepID=A0A852TWR9_9ACTN|nr:AMP-binding protein [Spinactinospora alkalitolerans]NYE48378.1 long-chain acyl-CoA synthetase [Spinactinospora alkalitolerans]
MGHSEVLRARTEVEAEIRGRTLVDWFRDAARQDADAPALSDRISDTSGDHWKTLTWGEYRQTALELAAAYIEAGVRHGDVVALMLPNRSEHLLADLGAVHAAAVPLTVYATFAPEQIAYVAADCRAKVAVIDGADQLARWQPVLDQLPELHTVVVRDAAVLPPPPQGGGPRFVSWDDFCESGRRRHAADPSEVEERMAGLRPGDAATMLYTSGTTGSPKGVAETHHQVLYQVTVAMRATRLPHRGITLSYLPLAHIAERVLSVYMPIRVSAHIHFCPDPVQVGAYLGLVRPNGLFGVPRVWEKLQAGLTAALGAAPQEQRDAIEAAAEVSRAHIAAGQYGRQRDPELAERFARVDEQVLKPIRALIGLDRAEFFASAAAPMPEEVLRFFSGLGITVRDIYGMTENCGAVTVNREDGYKFGSVGLPLDGIEVRIAEDGEIMVRGPINVTGYLNRPEESAALIDEDQWLHTGDIGRMDDDGFLYVVDRKKELIITAGGENIAPAGIESLLKEHPLIGQALAYGDRRPYPVALLTLDAEVAPGWAGSAGLGVSDLAELAQHPAVLAEVERAVTEANRRLARVQQVKRWRLLPVEWTAESEELTPTLKLKRRVIQTKYADAIDELYGS